MTPAGEGAVLVTGAGGRLGGLVVDALRNRGTRTIGLSRLGGAHPDDVAVDLTDLDVVVSVISGEHLDAVVHLAAVMHPDHALEDNASMDRAVAAVIRNARPRSVVLASSGAVYGECAGAGEDAPTLGASPYAKSKLASESTVRALSAEQPDLAATALRIFNIAGPRFDQSLVHRLLSADAEHPVTLVVPDGFIRDYVHQADVVRVILAALDRTDSGYRVLNVGAGVPVSTRRLLESLEIDEDAWIEAPGSDTSNWSDNRALVAALGVAPRAVPTRAWAGDDPGGE